MILTLQTYRRALPFRPATPPQQKNLFYHSHHNYRRFTHIFLRSPGKGRNQWADGSYYEGDFVKDMIQGKGKYVSEKSTYEGDFLDNVKHGKGVYKWKDGRIYEGQFEDDLKHGQGTLTWPDGYTYKGGFRKGVQHGDGSITENGKTHAVKFEKGHQLK